MSKASPEKQLIDAHLDTYRDIQAEIERTLDAVQDVEETERRILQLAQAKQDAAFALCDTLAKLQEAEEAAGKEVENATHP